MTKMCPYMLNYMFELVIKFSLGSLWQCPYSQWTKVEYHATWLEAVALWGIKSGAVDIGNYVLFKIDTFF